MLEKYTLRPELKCCSTPSSGKKYCAAHAPHISGSHAHLNSSAVDFYFLLCLRVPVRETRGKTGSKGEKVASALVLRLVSLMALGVVLVTLFGGSEIRLALLPPALLLPVRQVRLVWRFVDAEGLVGIERAVVKR